jgi:hypothetical protein
MREYKHPDFDHIFMIKDISPWEIEIDGIRVHISECDWMVKDANHTDYHNVGLGQVTLHDLIKTFLQRISSLTKNNN